MGAICATPWAIEERAMHAIIEIANCVDRVGIAIAIDDPVFLNIVQNYLANLEEIDILPKLREHWLEGDSSWVKYLAR